MSSWLLVRGGDVFDGMNSVLSGGTSVLVKDHLIHRIGSQIESLRGEVPRGEHLTEVDASGQTVMPGLIDAHCHMTYGESNTQEEIDLYTGVERRTLVAAANARRVLRSGVTSISQPGGSYNIGVALRDAISDGLVLGPNMFAAGRYITTSNGLVDYYPPSVGNPDSAIGKTADTLPGMLAEVRQQVKAGVDLIKLADSPYGQYQAFTTDEMKQIVDLAHQLGVRITIHARGSAEVKAAVEAGFDWIMHGNLMSDEVVYALAESKIPLVPTLLLLANLADWGGLCGSPRGQRDGCKRMLDKTADTLHRAHEAGVTFVSGTDTGFAVTPYGEWHAREMELLMSYAGLSAAEALAAMTSSAAVTVGADGEMGRVAEGMRADLITVQGNPLENLHVLVDKRNITTVIKSGAVVDFGKVDDEIRQAHPERTIAYSDSDLTYEKVYGEGASGNGIVLPDTEEGQDLLSSIGRRRLDPRTVVDA
jgi:imidazolonepropionase-like amidohydrolase